MVMQNAPEMYLEFSNDGFFSPFSMEDARAVRSPTMLVGGEISPRMFTLMLDALESVMPDVERRVFPGISHVPPFVAPADFNSAALSFLHRQLARP
ncbi:MAG: alpha/beta hydrolase [Betaproteobacteria bacterium]|nr:alpha/beta hydrolase [Betaproteobacteria bacterium]